MVAISEPPVVHALGSLGGGTRTGFGQRPATKLRRAHGDMPPLKLELAVLTQMRLTDRESALALERSPKPTTFAEMATCCGPDTADS